jgi:hypothetical protein
MLELADRVVPRTDTARDCPDPVSASMAEPIDRQVARYEGRRF